MNIKEEINAISSEGANLTAAALQFAINNQTNFSCYLLDQGHGYLIPDLGKLGDLRRLFNTIQHEEDEK